MRPICRAIALLLWLCLSPRSVAAQVPDDKDMAQELVRAGFEHVYEGEHALALVKFERAYELFASPKILLNIGTTLKKMGRYAESITIYERYLADPDTDPARRTEVEREIEDASDRVGRLLIQISELDVQVVVDGRAATLDPQGIIRVDPGSHTVVVHKDGFESRSVDVFGVKTGELRTVRIGMISQQAREAEAERERAAAFERGQASVIEALKDRRIETAGRFGASAGVAVAVQEPATSAIVGLSYGVATRFDVEAAVILGGDVAAYAGGRFFATVEGVRLSVSAGAPVFFIDGARTGVRGGIGAGLLIGEHFGFTVDLGVEHYFDLPQPFESTLFVPRAVLEGRL